MRAKAAGRVEIVRMKSDIKNVVAENAASHLTFAVFASICGGNSIYNIPV